jgi:hemerythrin-like domain-containing protein
LAKLVVGAVGTEIGNVVTASSSSTPSADPPDVDLMQEHGILKRVLVIYQESIERISSGQTPPLAAVHQGAEIIHEFIEGFHEPLDEGYVFPVLQKAGDL